MAGSDDKKKEGQQTPPETRLYSTPGADPNATMDSPAPVSYSDPNLDALSERFALIQELGRGGMGVVYKARDKVTDEIVALKVLRPEIAQDPALIERFKNEVRLSKKITHKNVCRIHDLHQIGGTAAITMEFVEGRTLRSWLRENMSFSIRRGTQLAQQIISGLQEAHDRGVVHRDLKPENLMLTPEGNIKIMDFGIARSLEGSTTVTEGLTGTPAYMSPEQAEGKDIDHRTDIYALGLILYEMFTGQMAFTGDTPVAVAFKQVHETPTTPREVDPDVPPRIEKAILQCIEKEPKKRFQSVEELSQSFNRERLETETPVETAPLQPVLSAHLLRWTRVDWVLLGLGTLGLIYFLSFRDTTFPASKMPLRLDAIAAQRQAENFANQIGSPLPSEATAKLEADDEYYKLWVLYLSLNIFSQPERTTSFSELVLPIRWKITYSDLGPTWEQTLGTITPGRYVILGREGEVLRFENPSTMMAFGPSYKPPPVQERRQIALQATELACGAKPEGLREVETVGGEGSATYSVRWVPTHPGETLAWARASVIGERTESIECIKASQETLSPMVQVFLLFESLFRKFIGIGLLFLCIFMLFHFALARGFRSHLFIRRAPIAIILGFLGMLIFTPGLSITLDSLTFFVLAGFAVSGLCLLGIVAAEFLLQRHMPPLIGSYVAAINGQLLEPAVGIAFFRGAIAGLFLLGGETALVHFYSTLVPSDHSGWVHDTLPLFLATWDPLPLSNAIESLSPWFYVLAASLFTGVSIGIALMGIAHGVNRRLSEKTKKTWSKPYHIAEMSWIYPSACIALGLPVSSFTGPGFGYIFIPYLVGVLLCWLLLRYDALTVTVAIGTMTLWSLNYPFLEIFREIGRGPHIALFTVWTILVILAALVAFRSQLTRLIKQFEG